MSTEYHIRFRDLIEIKGDNTVSVIGCGSIGSYVAKNLVKLGVTYLDMYDMDNVAEENIGTQDYNHSDIGEFKALALARSLNKMKRGLVIRPHIKRITSDSKLDSEVVFSCVDSMSARRDVFNVVNRSISTRFLIDVRMAIGILHIIVIPNTPIEMRNYDDFYLFDDRVALQEPCTNKATGYCAMVGAGLAISYYVDALKSNINKLYAKSFTLGV